jgi:hypothetical protein
VWVVLNRHQGSPLRMFLRKYLNLAINTVAAMLHPRPIAELMRKIIISESHIEAQYKNDPRVKIIKPQTAIPLRHFLDTNKKRLNETIDRGIADAEAFLAKQGL